MIDGSLLSYVDYCSTSFGRREFKTWVLRPLLSVSKINERLDSIEDLNLDIEKRDNLR